MIKQLRMENKSIPFSKTEQLSQLLLSLLPATVILLVGAYGSHLVAASSTFFFDGFFLLASIATFVGERKIISVVQTMQRNYCAELAAACQAFLAGNRSVTVTVQGPDEVAKLAEAINLLLDKQRSLLQMTQQSASTKPVPVQSSSKEAELIKQQLLQVIQELGPVTNGDLRVKITVTGKHLVGIIADTFNSFVEELAQFVKWTRYAAGVVSSAAQSVLERSSEMAKHTEEQMHYLSRTTNNIEEIVSFMQHLSNALHLNLDTAKEMQHNIRQRMQEGGLEDDTLLKHTEQELQRQMELLENVLQLTEETSNRAQSLIGDLYTVAQQIYQSSVGALKSVKRLSELEQLSEHWLTVASAFTLDEDESAGELKAPWLL